jgi:LuxR family maltose regulon positive regulatory protein
VARAYLAVADPAGAASAVSDAERIIRRRPDLGVLGTRLTEVREQIRGSADSLAGPSTFTPAELRVLPMLATQLTFEQIGLRLHVSQHTVKTQSVSIYAKLGVSGRRQAIARAIDIGLLEPFPRLRHDAWTSGD